MKGRIWLIVGVVVGVAIAIGDVTYLAGAAKSLADDAQRLVGTGGTALINAVAKRGAPHQVVASITSVLAVLIPGVTALLLVLAARGSLRLRAVIAVLLAGLGAVSFAYQSHGHALGVILLAVVIAVLAVVLTGPLVAGPLCVLAGLIGGEFLPRLLSNPSTLPNAPVQQLYHAIFNDPHAAGAPVWFRIVMLVVAVLPFGLGARLIVKG